MTFRAVNLPYTRTGNRSSETEWERFERCVVLSFVIQSEKRGTMLTREFPLLSSAVVRFLKECLGHSSVVPRLRYFEVPESGTLTSSRHIRLVKGLVNWFCQERVLTAGRQSRDMQVVCGWNYLVGNRPPDDVP
ncbi:hypothetical protein TNCV_518681 [Trichonephila clavipes]|nr:hypothetical protein TNCV_518681 [Trichonephila clavipes]